MCSPSSHLLIGGHWRPRPSSALGAQGVMEDTAGQGSRFTCVSGPATSGHLSGSHPGPSHQHGYLDPCRSLFSPSSLLQAVRKAACANHESDPGTPLLRTFERHSRETPRCSPIKALVPTGRCPGLGCASSLTSSPNRYGASHHQGCMCSEVCPNLPVQGYLPAQLLCHCPACFLEVTSWMGPLTHTCSCHQSERKPREGSCPSVMREKGVRGRKPRA